MYITRIPESEDNLQSKLREYQTQITELAISEDPEKIYKIQTLTKKIELVKEELNKAK